MAIINGSIPISDASLIPNKQQTATNNYWPWWADIIVAVLLDIISIEIGGWVGDVYEVSRGTQIVITTTTRIGVAVAYDEITTGGKADALTLGFDIGLPLISGIGQYSRLSKFQYNKLYQISQNIENKALSKELKSLAWELQQIEKVGIHSSDSATQSYKKILAKYQKLMSRAEIQDVYRGSIKHTGAEASKASKVMTRSWKKFNHALRVANKAVALIDPNYLVKKTVQFLARPLKKRYNKMITRVLSKFDKLSVHYNKALAHGILPLQSSWIYGVKLIQSPTVIGYFTMIIYFKPEATRSKRNPNGKPPVVLYNKSYKDFIEPFLDADSHGEYYLYFIQWGRQIGDILFNNKFLIGLNYVPYLSQTISTAYAVKRTALTVNSMVNGGFTRKINKQLNLWSSIVEGATTGLKGFGLVKVVSKTYQTKNSQYLINYGINKIRARAKKRYRNKWKQRF